MKSNVIIALAFIFAVFGSVSVPAKAPEASIRWAEGLLQGESNCQHKNEWTYPTRRRLSEAEQAFQQVLTKYGPDIRTYLGLGSAQMQLGKYAQAVQSFKRALSLDPKSVSVKSKLNDALKLGLIAKSAGKLLPPSHVVLRVMPYSVAKGADYWLVLSAKGSILKTAEDYLGASITDSRLTLFKGSPSNLTQVWQSGILKRGDGLADEFNDVQLNLKDLTGDGIPEAVVSEITYGGSWIPSHLDIFGLSDGNIISLLGVSSDFPLCVIDFDGDGRYEVMRQHAIGEEPAHYEQPVWVDIYAYNGRTYKLANSEFPEEFREVYKQIQTALKKYPDDPELLRYQETVRRILRLPVR